MNDAPKNIGLAAFPLVTIACCVGIPLIAAAGISIVVAAWTGGAVVGAGVLAAVVVLVSARSRSRQ